jgi:hypothetical protein
MPYELLEMVALEESHGLNSMCFLRQDVVDGVVSTYFLLRSRV